MPPKSCASSSPRSMLITRLSVWRDPDLELPGGWRRAAGGIATADTLVHNESRILSRDPRPHTEIPVLVGRET